MNVKQRRLDWTVLIVCTVGTLCSTIRSAEQTPQDVLDRWRAGQKAFERMVWRVEVRSQGRQPSEAAATFSGATNEFRADGKRFDLLVWRHAKLERPDVEMTPRGRADMRRLWDGRRYYLIEPSVRFSDRAQPGYVRVDVKADRNTEGYFCGMPLLGVFGGDREAFDTTLSTAQTLTLRQAKEETGGALCYVIDAETSSGRYNVWIDPTRGYHIVRAQVRKTDDDLYNGKPLNKYRSQTLAAARLPAGVTVRSLPELVSYTFTLTSATYEERDGVWVPMACQYEDVLEDEAGKTWTQASLKTLEMDCDPDFTASDAFKPDVPDGTMALVPGGGQPLTWKDGKVVDSYGYEVDPEHLGPPSLVGKTLPSLEAFGVGLDAELVQGKRLLVCFWSVNQRPSRICVQTLNARARTLAERNVDIVLVHAEPAVAETLTSWLEQKQIQPPVGTNRADMPALAHTWGVKSLPWLILTDKMHNVVAEGFGLSELEGKMDEAAGE
ncbi:MAG: hypothetical protein JW993_01700 [Sedimentisphaerales bacterium]|nr:hypothetical protein [Sedimentisphaerales bacterium]